MVFTFVLLFSRYLDFLETSLQYLFIKYQNYILTRMYNYFFDLTLLRVFNVSIFLFMFINFVYFYANEYSLVYLRSIPKIFTVKNGYFNVIKTSYLWVTTSIIHSVHKSLRWVSLSLTLERSFYFKKLCIVQKFSI